jgi:hypothetical protein
MKEVIWVFGYSCVGKKTIILEACNIFKDSALRGRLKLKPAIIPVIPSFGATVKRHRLINQVYESNIEATFLIHAQPLDYRGYLDTVDCGRAVYIYPSREQYNLRAKSRGRSIDYKYVQKDKEIYLPKIEKWFKEVIVI